MKVAKRPGVVWLIVVGAFVAALGLFSIVLPYVAGTAVAILVGAALLIAGLGEIIQSFSHQSAARKLGGLILGVITAVAGAVALSEPWLELSVLTLMLAGVLIASGIWRVVAAWSFRQTGGWLGLAFSGLIGIVLGVMILMGWPETSMWAIGTLVGVDLLFTGFSLIGLGLTLGKIASAADNPYREAGAPPTASV
jgi:uncharacterized membrane protein HdeD (DUF308 family)